ncbi:NADH:flavin oxidoreductase [Agrobacterium tumefaciens]|uniref:oxidoreductase n=1 Tax=Agrobacterium tumefaciens TaxID=358 RepID=UPI0012B8AB5A|nr:NADH:flavin oxidoreductase [Agrobacterium tumefaciens]MQB07285.1 NADH:flavin oxidoreductase [Agrobacterium tumefaciens]
MADNQRAYQPFSLGTTLPNRFAVAPMTRVSASESGEASAEMATYYERFARGGFGLVITEGAYTDQAFAQGYLYQPGISDAAQAEAWAPVVDSIHTGGAAAFAQIMHSGAKGQGNRFRDHTVAPSAVQPAGEQMAIYYGKGRYAVPRAVTDEEIADTIAGFAASAARAIAVSGFDGIELHAANGYLLDQFLTDFSNQRQDRWGGDARQRMTMIEEVFRAVRQALPGSVPVGVRISQSKVDNLTHKWTERERAAEAVFGTLSDLGVDFIHVTEHNALAPAFEPGGPTLIALTRRYAPQAALIANGALNDLDLIGQALDAGVDIVAIGKVALANPDLPTRLRVGNTLAAFDPGILRPIAHIKSAELEPVSA